MDDCKELKQWRLSSVIVGNPLPQILVELLPEPFWNVEPVIWACQKVSSAMAKEAFVSLKKEVVSFLLLGWYIYSGVSWNMFKMKDLEIFGSPCATDTARRIFVTSRTSWTFQWTELKPGCMTGVSVVHGNFFLLKVLYKARSSFWYEQPREKSNCNTGHQWKFEKHLILGIILCDGKNYQNPRLKMYFLGEKQNDELVFHYCLKATLNDLWFRLFDDREPVGSHS